jgi:hypothetical protein
MHNNTTTQSWKVLWATLTGLDSEDADKAFENIDGLATTLIATGRRDDALILVTTARAFSMIGSWQGGSVPRAGYWM